MSNPPKSKQPQAPPTTSSKDSNSGTGAPIAKPVMDVVLSGISYLLEAIETAYAHLSKLPKNALLFLYGFIICFFGGTFPVLFAAIQAADYSGRKAVLMALSDLAQEAKIIIEASQKDDTKDENKDGIPDVEQISHAEFVARKTTLVLRKMNPDKLDQAISSIYRVWLAVAAVLSIEFAKTISLSLVIADFLRRPIDHVIAPLVQKAIPKEYEKWIPVLLGWMAKAIAISIAFYIQTFMSGVASALKGGLMMAQATYQALVYRNIQLSGLINSPNHDESTLDEALSYVFAAMGFYTQFRAGFVLPTPLNLILWPFQLLEYYLRWSITKAGRSG